ncbi:NAD-dependent epimerase/dehydratase family protein [Nocardia fluminea]
MSTNASHVIVTGGAGFIGSHLCRTLLDRGDQVTAIDNLSTGRRENITDLLENPRFSLRVSDVNAPVSFAAITGATHLVHLACPASPKANTAMPLATLRTATVGTMNVLECAHRARIRAIVASSSEIYGDPLVHPQTEDYRGNADPIGAHSAYTEGKRATEAAAAAYHRMGADVGIVRPFNVYGPFMWPDDGRVVAAFCAAALAGETLKLQGGGTQTRSLVWVGDFVTGLLAMLDSTEFGPINLGSEHEITIRDLAQLIIDQAGSGSLDVVAGRSDVVTVRRPDTTRARKLLDWQPETPLDVGIAATLAWMRTVVVPS